MRMETRQPEARPQRSPGVGERGAAGSLLARQRRRAVRAFLIAGLILAVVPPTAWGHAAFLGSQPEPGSRLEAGPTQIELTFTEPLNRELSSASLINLRSGEAVPSALVSGGERGLVLRPQERLGRAAYEVRWHTVSTLDGHPLEGSFSFGVRTAAAGGEHSVEQSPLARDGWLRIGARAGFYAVLLFFAGGVLNAALLARRRPQAWLLPEAIADSARRAGIDPEARAEALWQRTLAAGAIALVLAIAVALIEAADASGGLSADSVDAYLLSNGAGLARVGTVAAVGVALLLARKAAVSAAATLAIAFLTIALSGHANSADPRGLAVLTDWIHLLAASVWIGGIAQLATAWLPALRDAGLRRAVIRSVLPRFGRVAFPAFLVVVATGSANALIQLGHPEELWSTAYGRVLAVKIALVALIAAASYLHALRMRPRLLSANPHPQERRERRHWRLLGVEPWLGLGVIAIAAVLVAFPLPPRQLTEAGEAEAAAPCSPSCPLAVPAPDQLAVASHLGPNIAAFWLRREGETVDGSVRLLDLSEQPVDASVDVPGGTAEECGIGCWRLHDVPTRRELSVSVEAGERQGEISVPALFSRARDGTARQVLERAQAAMRALRSARLSERVTSGLGQTVQTAFRFAAPDRMAYRSDSGSRVVAIGKTSYVSSNGGPFERGPFGAGSFRFAETFRWTVYGRSVRWLGASRRYVRLALFDPGTPVWYRLTIDRATERVIREQMVASGHFMERRYFAFNRPVRIVPPR
jgi:copper transport protein